MEQVILVDENDHEIGLMEKMEAHEKGFLHRAFSVFIFNSKGEMLIQQRAANKYHSPKLWANTCCSHQGANESNLSAAKRRLKEEMGLTTDLKYIFNFIYKVKLDNNLYEHELDHVFYGTSDQLPKANAEEVMAYKYLSPQLIKEDIETNPNHYTEWFKICIDQVLKNYPA